MTNSAVKGLDPGFFGEGCVDLLPDVAEDVCEEDHLQHEVVVKDATDNLVTTRNEADQDEYAQGESG